MNKYFLQGNQVGFRQAEREDYTGAIPRWINDSEVTKFLYRGITPATVEESLKEFENLPNDKDSLTFSLCDKKSDRLIGTGGLYGINWISRHAELRILLGEKEYWGKGCGKEATMLLVAYGFERLNLNRVWLGVNVENKSAVETYLKSNFTNEGELRDEFFRNGRYYNVFRMSILKREYEEVKKSWPIYLAIKNQLLASE